MTTFFLLFTKFDKNWFFRKQTVFLKVVVYFYYIFVVNLYHISSINILQINVVDLYFISSINLLKICSKIYYDFDRYIYTLFQVYLYSKWRNGFTGLCSIIYYIQYFLECSAQIYMLVPWFSKATNFAIFPKCLNLSFSIFENDKFRKRFRFFGQTFYG